MNVHKEEHQQQPKSFQLSYENSWLLWNCQFVNLASLSLEISYWMLVILALFLCLQAFLLRTKVTFNKKITLPKTLIILFAISGSIAIALTAKNNGILISMVNLLTFAYMLKSFEIQKRKDFYQISLLGFFIIGSAFIFKQDLLFSILMLFALMLNFSLLLKMNLSQTTLFSSFKKVSALVLQSSILAIILFIIFPRLTPFWKVPNANSAKTGLSDEVSPGDIANLALSSNLAFRVDFKGSEIPRYSNLYWRAMTLENYDGRKWTRGKYDNKTKLSEKSFKPNIQEKSITYDVIVEPSYQYWLYGLSVATSEDTNVRLNNDYTIRSLNIIGKTTQYQVKSYLQSPLDERISYFKKEQNLAIKKGSNPRLEQLAQELKLKYSSPIEISNAVLLKFNEQHYFYTLKAPLLINNSLDQFFFDTKAGFCVHYASAYAYLMRAAGIPARIVTGYLGGEFNSTGSAKENINNGHLSIYQYDAHAWAEIWLKGIGWQRVDPTAAVDPQRVNSGWSDELINQQSFLSNDLLGLYEFKNIAWINQLRLQFDALDYQWTRWVLGYSSQQQLNFLKLLFGSNIQWKSTVIIGLSLIFLMVFFILIFRIKISLIKNDKLVTHEKIFQKSLKLFSKAKITKPLNCTPSEFATIIENKKPELSREFNKFIKLYEALKYQNLTTTDRINKITLLTKHYATLKKLIKSN